MKKEFVSYELAGCLEEMGFNEPCLATIDQTEYIHIKGTKEPIRAAMMYYPVDCPLYQQAFRWFREKYDITYSIVWKMPIDGNGYKAEIQNGNDVFYVGLYSYYEEAELACLLKLIEIVKYR